MVKRPRIWLTRPQEDSAALAAELEKLGIASIVAPVMHITRAAFTVPTSMPNAILLTSRHAAYAVAQLPASFRALPTYCVGSATAHMAREFGCSNIIPGSGDVLALLPRLAASMGPNSDLLYLAGEEVSVDVAHLLSMHSIRVSSCVVYRSVAETKLPDTLIDAVKANTLDAVAFFSSRSALVARNLLEEAGLAAQVTTIEAFCLSLQVAANAGGLPWKKLHACHQPTREAMRDLMVSQLQKTL